MEASWLDTYYSALEFVYWEPQHLRGGKSPDPSVKRVDLVNTRLRRLEVTLNHNLDQFFRLAPTALRNQLFEGAFSRQFADSFELHGRNVDREFSLLNSMQPDMVFESLSDVVSIEMKIGAKCSVAQVLKYALLGLAVELTRKKEMSHSLIILGRGPFSTLWDERFGDLASLESGLRAADIETFLSKMPSGLRSQTNQFMRIVHGLQVAFLPYSDLKSFLREQSPTSDDTSAGAQVYQKLISGMIGELSNRQL